MIIFLRNIPSETQKYEIASFIYRPYNDHYLNKPSANISLEDIKFLSILDVNSNTLEKHALVNVFPNEAGKSVIKKLNGIIFKGKYIEIREYVNRSMNNDPRNELSADATINYKEQRVSDRRRQPLVNSWQNDPILVHA